MWTRRPTANRASTADGDDNDPAAGPDDEEGITFLTPIMPGEPFTIRVTSTSGYLNAWIDFNGDGAFGAGERIATEFDLGGGGTQELSYTAPPSTVAFASTMYSRFRITQDEGEVTSPSGLAPNGEVEDYALMSLGDLVWLDNGADGGTADNGIQDGGETGIADVVVELYREGQDPLTTPGAGDDHD